MKTVMLRIRIEPEFKDKLQHAVKAGLAESMSDLIRNSVNSLLENKKASGQARNQLPVALGASTSLEVKQPL